MRFTKKLIALVLTLVIATMPSMVLANETINVTIGGQAVTFPDQGPVIVDGRTLVPVAGVFQSLDFDVQWNPEDRTVTLTRSGDTVVITIDSSTFTTNGASHTLDVPAQLIGGRTMLPIATVLRSVGYDVDWDGSTQTVAIATTAVAVPTPVQPAPTPPEPTPTPPTPEPTPPVVDTSLEAFLSHFNVDIVREVLGVDFEIDAQEFNDGAWTWRSLNLSSPLNLNNLGIGDNSDAFGSNTGDAFIVLWDGDAFLYIDLGATSDEIIAAWAEEDGRPIDSYIGVRAFHVVQLDEESISDLYPGLDIGAIREILGVDFTISNEEHQGIHNDNGEMILLRWNFLELDGELNLNEFSIGYYDDDELFGSQRGDAFIVTWPNGSNALVVNIGTEDEPNAHALFFLPNFPRSVTRNRSHICKV